MPITLSLTGYPDPSGRKLTRGQARAWLAGAAVWFENRGDAVLDAHVVHGPEDRARLLVLMHPASPPVEIRIGASGRVRLSANTTPAGPGYHAFLCDTLDQFAEEFEFAWGDADDPTGYFDDRDRAALEEAFRRWLATACVAAEANGSKASVGLPAGHGFHATGEVLTPLGPRPVAWLATAGANPRDFFPWWNPDLDAAFYRNRALVRMWCDFPWRPPLTEAEGEVTDQIANDLTSAFKRDPAAELPWHEWQEVLHAIEHDEEGFTVAPAKEATSVKLWKRNRPTKPPARPIGYRRHPVRVPLSNGWSVEVPGDFAREWDEGHAHWTAWNRTHSVWFHCLGYAKPGGVEPSAAEAIEMSRSSLPDGEKLPPFERNGVVSEAVYGPTVEDGRTVWRLAAIAAVPGQVVVCHVYTEGPDDREWAVKTWHSLRHA